MLSRLASRVAVPASRSFRTSAAATDKVVMVLYPDPTTGYPPKYARDDIPVIDVYADGQTAPTPKGRDFVPGELLGSVSVEDLALGIIHFRSNGSWVPSMSMLWFLG